MYRLAEENIKSWSASQNRKPLILRGARQVGKSTLVRNITQKLGHNLVEINLEKYPELDDIFATLKLERILRELEGIVKKKINVSQDLLFLDEIQATPNALAALRYFYEEKQELRVIATGSLLETVLSEHNFSMPVGRVEYLHLGPMLFSEFLLAIDEQFLYEKLINFRYGDEIPSSLHQEFLHKQNEYFITGGLPEAVLVYSKTKDFAEVSRVQSSISETYKDDFAKYAKKHELNTLRQVYAKTPQLVGQKVKYVNFSTVNQAREIRVAIELLAQAKLVTRVFHSSCSGLPLSANQNNDIFKLYFLDIGLMLQQMGVSWVDIKNFTEQRLLNSGGLAEQFIAQHLLYLGASYQTPQLNYWLREEKSGNSEIDFVLAHEGRVIPIEVKSGLSGTLKSLHQFMGQKKLDVAVRFDLNQPAVQGIEYKIRDKGEEKLADYTLCSFPTYLISEFGKILPELE